MMRLNNNRKFAHDMRSSLTPIKEAIALISDGLLGRVNSKQKKCLRIAQNQIKKIVALVDKTTSAKPKRRQKT